jgi:hypothetical protein
VASGPSPFGGFQFGDGIDELAIDSPRDSQEMLV